MQEFPAAEKILNDIDSILRKDTNLKSFEIIPIPDNKNKSPVYHVENSLGLASWCIQPLYIYTYNKILNLREKKLIRREDPINISKWLMGALMLNPDLTTFWNIRRELVISKRIDINQELRLVKIILYNKAKCFDAFSYRRWLLQLILIDKKLIQEPQIDPNILLRNELKIAEICADRYANNYHAWNYRQFIMSTYELLLPTNFGTLLTYEWNNSSLWCFRNVSDHSGFSYRQSLLKKIILIENSTDEVIKNSFTTEDLKERRDLIHKYLQRCENTTNKLSFFYKDLSTKILNTIHSDLNDLSNYDNDNEDTKTKQNINYDRVLISLSYWFEDLIFNGDLMSMYSSHETVWCHRKFIAYVLIIIDESYNKYSTYKDEEFKKKSIKNINKNKNKEIYNNTILKCAFAKANRDIIDTSIIIGGHDTVLAEKFDKYLKEVGLDCEK